MLALEEGVRRSSRLILVLALALAVLPSVANAQARGEKAAAEPNPDVMAVRDLALAQQLVTYGQRTGTAEPLIAAARILIETPFSDPTYEGSGSAAAEGAESGEKAEEGVPRLNVSGILASARDLAGDDENMLAVIAELEASMTKGRLEGPGTGTDVVDAYSSFYYKIAFQGGELAIVEIVGDGDTDLDCYVYDEYENLLDYDEDYTDHCILMWTPSRTGIYEIWIDNLGDVWNRFTISTN
jgi:hypothetical protein